MVSHLAISQHDKREGLQQAKAKAEQDLISRRLANTTVRQSSLRAIENDTATELEKATREYNRAIADESTLTEVRDERQERQRPRIAHLLESERLQVGIRLDRILQITNLNLPANRADERLLIVAEPCGPGVHA